ncbi:putative histone acetyltransferase [Phaeomoniella chlamydospora]|uniref:histone acetyltransferase n=1 Tax=Phaeomoniella chlamydospora TaxID=158046 RepID=A0A0G2GY90_PHACM|nr:putative histone acetyltransferase [Phaeomoniella chlamydospora]
MSVSYKLSGWEWEGGVIGGPEKPLSAMGKKSYSRFWEERVARYLLGESRDADGRRILDRVSIAKRKPKKEPNKKKREVLTVREIGERTGMLAEDVVVALVGMGVCEQVGRKSSTKKALETTNGENKSQPAASENEKEIPINLNIKKSKVLDWAKKNGLEFENPVAEEGFLGEWALSDENSDVDMDEEEDEDEESSE